MDATTYGLDIAKRVSQMHWVEVEAGEIFNRLTTNPSSALTRRTADPVVLLAMRAEILGQGHPARRAHGYR